jgi:hypothetical protein
MTKYTQSDIDFDKLMKPTYDRAMEDLDRKHPSQLDPGNPNHPQRAKTLTIARAEISVASTDALD